jgi:preprotein translocase subunit SecB
MAENFKILAEFVKDMSSETQDIESYLFVKENLSKYHLLIDITSKPIKNNMIEISTTIKYHDKENNDKRSYFEIIYATVIKLTADIKDKKELEKILLCDVQNEIYPRLEKVLLNLISDSGYSGIKFEKKIDFDKLYKEQFN